MSYKILIGRAKAKNDKEEVVELKIYLGNIVELPDGTQTSLREDTYKKILEQWETEHISIIPPTPQTPEPVEETGVSIPSNESFDSEKTEDNTAITVESSNDDVDAMLAEIREEEEELSLDHFSRTEKEEKDIDFEESRVLDKKSNRKFFVINLIVMILIIAATFIATPYISAYLENQSSDISSTHPLPTPEDITNVCIIRVTQDIPQGEIITEEMITEHVIDIDEYTQLNNAVYVNADGSTSKGSLITSDKIEIVIGKFATRNISEGTYITSQDFSQQKIIAEKTFVEVEIDGQTVSVPVDKDFLTGDTRVKIVALITTDNNEETLAIALSEFVLEDRTLQDIFDSAGQSILDKLSAK